MVFSVRSVMSFREKSFHGKRLILTLLKKEQFCLLISASSIAVIRLTRACSVTRALAKIELYRVGVVESSLSGSRFLLLENIFPDDFVSQLR